MTHYILMLRKDDVIDLFKYGQIIPYCQKIKYEKPLSDLTSDKKTASKFYAGCNFFDYSIEYFIVVVESKAKLAKEISINQVRKIYAIDTDSYKVGLNLNPAVEISEPIWVEEYQNFQAQSIVRSAHVGLENVIKLFGIDGLDKAIKPAKHISEDLVAACHDNYKDLPLSGKHGIWYYLLRYERHQNYPKDNRGYFLDMFHAWANWNKSVEIDADFKKHHVGALIMSAPEKAIFSDLWKLIEDNEKDTLKKMNKSSKQLFKTAPFYFWLRDRFKDGLQETFNGSSPIEQLVQNIQQKQDETPEVKCALQLLGYSLGRELTYKYTYTHDSSITIMEKPKEDLLLPTD